MCSKTTLNEITEKVCAAANFNKDYIKTKIVSAKFSKIIKNAFEVRNDSDYDEFYIISKKSVTAQIEHAKEFLAAVKEYLAPRLQPPK